MYRVRAVNSAGEALSVGVAVAVIAPPTQVVLESNAAGVVFVNDSILMKARSDGTTPLVYTWTVR